MGLSIGIGGIGINARRGASPISALFPPGTVGFAIAPSDTSTRMFQETTGALATTPAVSGDRVGTIRCGYTGTYLTAPTNDRRLTLGTNAGKLYLSEDAVDDILSALSIDLNNDTYDFGMSFKSASGDIICLHNAGTNTSWIGIGQSGSASTAVASFNAINAEYFDNAVSANTTRGQNFTSFQASTTYLANATADATTPFNPTVGAYFGGANFGLPGEVYSIFLRVGTMNASQRAQWHAWAASFVPA